MNAIATEPSILMTKPTGVQYLVLKSLPSKALIASLRKRHLNLSELLKLLLVVKSMC